MGDFSHPDICWKGNTAGHKLSGNFLQYIDVNFFLQVIEAIEEPARRGTNLDLVLTHMDGWWVGCKV